MMMDGLVTTGYRRAAADVKRAKATAEELRIPYLERAHMSYEEIRKERGISHLLVAKKGGLRLITEAGEMFFHPNMAYIRVKNLRKGLSDHMLEAMDLRQGDSVLDATMGLGADAIVASYAAGEAGCVVALETSPYIYAVVKDGLAHQTFDHLPLVDAMRRIQPRCTDALAYLREQPTSSVDVVYFDPMFRHPLKDSVQLEPLRMVANHEPVSETLLEEAKRVARRRVVLKENSRSREFERLKFTHFAGGKYSAIRYGYIVVSEQGQ
ncbi:class I SAM-dependent methyltransferase [Selenomonas sp. TAMA-11512]|uniref:class I SAM-dependent methyltransferase n=1 Tax=Selenomonas sp. TAMA-11512 TaxID=3095337 RepID=UPI00308FD9FE|nr:class I SAM-dependent methyltransferase [Selenomonas sp. TAMA-11512]